jgi:ankyrin repeat protein
MRLVFAMAALSFTFVTQLSAECGNFCDKEWLKTATAADWQAELTAGTDVNARNSFGSTPIVGAIYLNGCDPSVVQLLLKSGASVKSRDHNGDSVLHNAGLCTKETFIELINSGADVNAKNKFEETVFGRNFKNLALYGTTYQPPIDHNEKAQILVEMGANLDVLKNLGWSELHEAIMFNWLEGTLFLLESGANVNLVTSDISLMNTALHLVSCDTNYDLVKSLLDFGANVNARNEHGDTPLHSLVQDKECAKNPFQVAKALIEAGADGKAKNKNGKTPFDLANENRLLKETETYWLLNDALY